MCRHSSKRLFSFFILSILSGLLYTIVFIGTSRLWINGYLVIQSLLTNTIMLGTHFYDNGEVNNISASELWTFLVIKGGISIVIGLFFSSILLCLVLIGSGGIEIFSCWKFLKMTKKEKRKRKKRYSIIRKRSSNFKWNYRDLRKSPIRSSLLVIIMTGTLVISIIANYTEFGLLISYSILLLAYLQYHSACDRKKEINYFIKKKKISKFTKRVVSTQLIWMLMRSLAFGAVFLYFLVKFNFFEALIWQDVLFKVIFVEFSFVAALLFPIHIFNLEVKKEIEGDKNGS